MNLQEFGYVAGNYEQICCYCDKHFLSDKYHFTCYECALNLFVNKSNDDNIVNVAIKYHDQELEKIEKIEQGDWIDLRAAETVNLKQFDYYQISLGISIKIPNNYEMNIVARSSTFKKFGIIQTNSFGVIDSSYCGDDDIIKMPVIALRDTIINKNDRICQFRLTKKQPEIIFNQVEKLSDQNRGGFGSTGIN